MRDAFPLRSSAYVLTTWILIIGSSSYGATQLDSGLSPHTVGVQLEIQPRVSSTAINDFVTVNWSVGSTYPESDIRGEIRLSGASCTVKGVRNWSQVTRTQKGAGRLTLTQDARGCSAEYCLIARTNSGGTEQACQRIDLQAPRAWLQLNANVADIAVTQDVALVWESDQVKNLGGSVSFSGANCSLKGTSKSWSDFFGSAPSASGIQFREGNVSIANCSVLYCLSGNSSLNNTPLSACSTVQYFPSEWRAKSWVRDGRYVHEPSMGKTSHITWAIQNDPEWLAPTTEVAVGTMPGRSDIIGWTPISSESGVRFTTPSHLFTYGRLYFASVRVREALGRGTTVIGNGWRYLQDNDWPRLAPTSKTSTWKNTSLMEVVEDSTVGLRSNEDIDRVRGILIRQLWPKEGRLPTAMPIEVQEIKSVYQTLAPLIGEKAAPHQNDAAELPQLLEGIADATGSLKKILIRLPSGMESHAYWFRPRTTPVNRLAIVHQGHDDIAGTYGGGRSILFFLRNGFDVVSLMMPASGPNTASFKALMDRYAHVYPIPSGTRPYHNDLFELAKRVPPGELGEHPVATYLSPIRIALNYLNQQISFQDISMIGCSGGGWTTTLYAALDPQIRFSFPVAGSIPLELRRYRPVDYSDNEQHAADIYSIAGYRDLYTMGAAGAGRKQVQILNGKDDCCFRPSSSPPEEDATYSIAYTNIHEIYASQVKKAAADFGGSFDVAIDSPALHTISHWTLWSVVAPVLGLAPKMVLTMNGLEGGRDRQPRTPIAGDSKLRYEWRCENCTGNLRGGYSYGGCAPPASNIMIDWIKGPKGFNDVAAAASRIGCWIDLTLATEGSPVRTTTRYDWVHPALVPTKGPPSISFKMNGVEGSRNPASRTPIRGYQDLVYDWSCENCEEPPKVRYSFGGSCGSGNNLPVDWVNTIRGHQFVRGGAARVGCWINFMIRVPGSNTDETVYFDWVP